MTNDRALIQISADSRALIRAAIKRNPGWREYANLNDVDLGTLTTKGGIFDCCDALGIDIADTIAESRADRRMERVVNQLTEIEPLPAVRPRLFGRERMTDEEASRLHDERALFLRNSNASRAVILLGTAYEIWNESHMTEIELAGIVQLVSEHLAT